MEILMEIYLQIYTSFFLNQQARVETKIKPKIWGNPKRGPICSIIILITIISKFTKIRSASTVNKSYYQMRFSSYDCELILFTCCTVHGVLNIIFFRCKTMKIDFTSLNFHNINVYLLIQFNTYIKIIFLTKKTVDTACLGQHNYTCIEITMY